MAWKLIFSIALLIIAVSAVEPKGKDIEYEDGPAEYEFSYAVHDDKTGDIKSQKESRKGDKVEGSYELIDSDGHRRLVEYKADDHNGFTAVVHREPTDIKIPIPEHKVEEHKFIAPLVHYTPVAKVVVAAPAKIIAHEAPKFLIKAPAHHLATHVSFHGPDASYHY